MQQSDRARTAAVVAAICAALVFGLPAASVAAEPDDRVEQPAVAPLAPAPASESWPFERGGPGRPGSLVHEPLRAPFLPAWEERYALEASRPALAVGGRLVFVARNSKSITAVEPATGAPLWRYVPPDKVVAGPVADGNALYFVDGKDRLRAVSLETGKAVADLLLQHAGDTYGVEGTPGIADGDLFFGSRSFFLPWKNAGLFRVATAGGLAIAATGDWPVKLGNDTLYGVGAAGGRVFLGVKGGRVLGFDQATGKKLFTLKVKGNAVQAPAVDASLVLFVTDDNLLQALDHQGNALWSKRFASEASGPALGDGLIFVAAGKSLHALARDGRESWSIDLPRRIVGNPAVTREAVVVATEDGTILWINPADGTEVWRFRIAKTPIGSPLIYHDRLFVFDEGEQLHCFVDYGHVDQAEERRSLLTVLLEATLDKEPTLEQIGATGTDAIPALLRAVQEKDWGLQARAVEWLIALGAVAVPEIAASPLLATGTTEQRTFLLEALGSIGDPNGLPAAAALVKLRGDTHAAASAAARGMLPNLVFPGHEPLLGDVNTVFLDGNAEAAAVAGAALERAGAAAIPVVVADFAIKGQREKSGALLRRLADAPAARATLQERLLSLAETTANHELGAAAIALLGEIGDRDALEPLTKLAPHYPASGSCLSSGPKKSPATAAAEKIKARLP